MAILLSSRSGAKRLVLAATFAFLPSARASFHSRMSFSTERQGSGTITVAPKRDTDQSALVVISHGLGDTAEGFVDVAERFAQEMPHVKFVLPTAPTQPVTMNMGMPMPSWYDITGLDERSNEDCKGIDESRARIVSILDREHEENKLPYNRMVLMGFSQGGALSVFTGMQLPHKLAGIVMMSAYLPAANRFAVTPGLQDTPILHCHGTADPLVSYAMAERTQQRLNVPNYELVPFVGLPHSVSLPELVRVQAFLQTILPPNDAYRIQPKDPRDMSIKELKAALRNAGKSTVGLCEKSEFIKLLQEHRQQTN